MRNNLLCLFLLLGATQILVAQCPTSTRSGVHVVQQGENLYRIAERYQLSLNQIMTWNNLNQGEYLPLCKELFVTPPAAPTNYGATSGRIVTPASSGSVVYNQPSTYVQPDGRIVYPSTTTTSMTARGATYSKQPGNRHTVQPGQTVRGLADLYGYTERRFREFNSLGNEELTPGSVVLSSDCGCADRMNYQQPDGYGYQEGNRGGAAVYPNNTTTGNRTGTTTTGNRNSGNINYNGSTTDPRPRNYDYDLPGRTGTTGTTNANRGTTRPAPPPARSGSASYMNAEENDMLREINLMRGNPAGYVRYVREYANRANSGQGFPVSQTTVNELIGELQRTQPLSILQPMPCVYEAARKHGEDIRQRGDSGHVGSDGSYPWDRVLRECPTLADGNENLVAGPSTVRDAVIMLLLDEGIPNRGHRRTMMQADWKYGATYKIGQVGIFPNSWVQKFAR